MTHADFLRAVLADPADDTPRLVYADWLDERGDVRGEFIRVQCELAKAPGMPLHNHRYRPSTIARTLLKPACPACRWRKRYDALRRRERELLDKHAHEWLFDLPPGLRPILPYAIHDTFRRGFVAAVTLPAEAWLGSQCRNCTNGGLFSTCATCRGIGRTPGHAAALLACCPLETVRLTTRPQWVQVAAGQGYGRLVGRQKIESLGCIVGARNDDALILKLLDAEWPGLRFELPATTAGTFADPAPDPATLTMP